MYRYTTDVIASCAFGINGHALKIPQSEFRTYARNIFDFSVRKELALLMALTAPAVKNLLNIKFLDDETTRYLRKKRLEHSGLEVRYIYILLSH
jgi:hypothetical protein